jgi:hypothetical protein
LFILTVCTAGKKYFAIVLRRFAEIKALQHFAVSFSCLPLPPPPVFHKMTDLRWQVVQAFFQERGLVRQQLDSFDDFISHGLQDAISGAAPISVNEAIGHEQESESVVGSPAEVFSW